MVRRAALLAASCGLLLAQKLNEPAPDTALAQTQALVDAGKFSEAEASARSFLDAHNNSADAHYLLSYILFREGNAKTSLTEFDRGSQFRSPRALDLAVAGGDYFLMEDYASADRMFTKSVEANPGDAMALYFLGRTKYNETHFDEAIDALNRSLKLDPANARADEYLGLSYERLGKTDEALAAYRAAIAAGTEPAWAGPYIDLGALLTDNNQPKDALPYLLQAVQIAPGDAQAHRQLGKAYLRLVQLAQALAELQEAANLAPQDATIHFLLAQVYQKLNLPEKARAETDRYTELTGSHSAPDTPLAEARSLLQIGKTKEAEQAARAWLSVHPNSAEGHFLLGYILFREADARASLVEYTEGARYRAPSAYDLEVVGCDYVLLEDYTDADKWFTKSVEWNPGNIQAIYYLGRTKYNENRFDEAIRTFGDCLKLDPKNVRAEDNLGLSYEGLGRTDDAIAAYRQAIAWQSDLPLKNSGPYIDLGAILIDNNRPEDGVPLLLQAVAITPRDVKAHRELGKAYLHMNRLPDARKELETAVQLAPQNASLHFMLGQTYRREGLSDKAKAEFDRYAALNGTHSTPETAEH